MRSKGAFKTGDVVRVIDDTMTGTVVRIHQQKITIECQDGFLYTFNTSELVPNEAWNSTIAVAHKDTPPQGRNIKGQRKTKKGEKIKEIDLHIHELTESEAGMTNFDKLSLQLNTAKKALETAIEKKQSKIVFIHGLGTGVLKKELRLLLGQYHVAFHDASYTEYGLGATEVIIFQNQK